MRIQHACARPGNRDAGRTIFVIHRHRKRQNRIAGFQQLGNHQTGRNARTVEGILVFKTAPRLMAGVINEKPPVAANGMKVINARFDPVVHAEGIEIDTGEIALLVIQSRVNRITDIGSNVRRLSICGPALFAPDVLNQGLPLQFNIVDVRNFNRVGRPDSEFLGRRRSDAVARFQNDFVSLRPSAPGRARKQACDRIEGKPGRQYQRGHLQAVIRIRIGHIHRVRVKLIRLRDNGGIAHELRRLISIIHHQRENRTRSEASRIGHGKSDVTYSRLIGCRPDGHCAVRACAIEQNILVRNQIGVRRRSRKIQHSIRSSSVDREA